MGIFAPLTLALMLALVPPAATPIDECTDLQRPATFDKESAMLAVFCAYDGEHAGTLLPVELTEHWEMDDAETVASPIIAITYREGAIEKAVLAVQLQEVFEGDVSISHAQTVLVSIYVFERRGGRWVIEKRAEEAFDEGHNGEAPGVQLVKLGPERFGLWFSIGDVHQGYLSESAMIVTLSETRIREVARLDMGGANAGTCSDNPKERGNGIYACWSYEATPAFIATRGTEYYTLRITYAGTDEIASNSNRVRRRNEAVCLTKGGGEYNDTTDAKCGTYKPIPKADVFLGDGAPRTKPPQR